jgi:hypothetical protein
MGGKRTIGGHLSALSLTRRSGHRDFGKLIADETSVAKVVKFAGIEAE